MPEENHPGELRGTDEQVLAQRQFAVSRAALVFLQEHPFAVQQREDEWEFSGDEFRRFLLGLVGPRGLARGMSMQELSDALQVPVAVLEGLLRPR